MRILFVAMQFNVTTARWIRQLRGHGWDLHLFPINAARVHAELSGVTVHGWGRNLRLEERQNRRLRHSIPCAGRVQKLLDRLSPGRLSAAARLARIIERLNPDILHSLEMQRAGYLTLDALRLMNGCPRPPWVYSCWGNDIYLFGRDPAHEPRVREVLRRCDYLIADCERDLRLARHFGFEGEILGVVPGGGGFDITAMRELRAPGKPSSRRTIAVKGYQSAIFGGRGNLAAEALASCGETLRGYEIVLYSGEEEASEVLQNAARRYGARFQRMPQRSPQQDVVRLMGRSRVALALSVSDGTPNTMLEAMITGAFPVQSDTVSTREWICGGQNGLLVPPEDSRAVAQAVRRALSDDALVDAAAEVNARITEKIDSAVVQPRVIDMYKSVAARAGVARGEP